MSTLLDLERREKDLLRRCGGLPSEDDMELNEITIRKIEAFHKEKGKAYLGKINYYGEEKEALNTLEVLKKYEGRSVYTFDYDFIVPENDVVLVSLIRDYNQSAATRAYGTAGRIDKIFKRIDEIGGSVLLWV